jgi:hypothetical protein
LTSDIIVDNRELRSGSVKASAANAAAEVNEWKTPKRIRLR